MKDCTIYKTMDIIGKRWTLLILLELYKNEKRFLELKKRILGITSKMLTLRLNELIEKDMIEKKSSYAVTTYRLTAKGQDFSNVIQDFKKWALRWEKNETCANRLCKQCEGLLYV